MRRKEKKTEGMRIFPCQLNSRLKASAAKMLTNKPWSFTKASNTQQQYSSLSSDEETLAEGTEDQKLGEKEQRSFSSSSKLILVVLGVALLLNVFLLWTTLCLYKQSRDVTKSEHDDAKSPFPVCEFKTYSSDF